MFRKVSSHLDDILEFLIVGDARKNFTHFFPEFMVCRYSCLFFYDRLLEIVRERFETRNKVCVYNSSSLGDGNLWQSLCCLFLGHTSPHPLQLSVRLPVRTENVFFGFRNENSSHSHSEAPKFFRRYFRFNRRGIFSTSQLVHVSGVID